jgi:hypothetical protein
MQETGPPPGLACAPSMDLELTNYVPHLRAWSSLAMLAGEFSPRMGFMHRASGGRAPTNLREALVGPLQRVQVRGVVQVERRLRELHNPPVRRGTP